MTDRFSNAVKEMEDKSPFVCESCGHPDTIGGTSGQTAAATGEIIHDRFSEAIRELEEKSAFVCESCEDWQRTSTRH